MKQLLLTLSCIFMLTACQKTKGPENTVREYLQAIDNFEYEKADALLVVNPENKAAMDNLRRYTASLNEAKKEEILSKAKHRTYNIIEKESTENEALLIATNNEGEYTLVVKFNLVKSDERWLIKNFSDAN